MKKNYCLALMILLITGIGFTNLAVGYSPTYTPNTNYRSTYLPNPSYNSFTSPIQLSGYNNPNSVPLDTSLNTITNVANRAASFSKLVQEEFRIVGDSNEPIPGAQVVGLDGSSNRFQKFTDNNGYVAINGTPGNWQFTVYAEGYFPKSGNSNVPEYNTNMLLMLQRIGVQEKPNDNQFGNKNPIPNMIADETADKTIVDWLCESNGNSNQDSDMPPDQSTDTGAKG